MSASLSSIAVCERDKRCRVSCTLARPRLATGSASELLKAHTARAQGALVSPGLLRVIVPLLAPHVRVAANLHRSRLLSCRLFLRLAALFRCGRSFLLRLARFFRTAFVHRNLTQKVDTMRQVSRLWHPDLIPLQTCTMLRRAAPPQPCTTQTGRESPRPRRQALVGSAGSRPSSALNL